MRMSLKQLRKMIVETLSGTKLGKIQDIIFDIEGQVVVQYEVKHTGISGINYLIHRDQIVKFEEKKVIVYDTVLKQSEKKKMPALKVIPDGGVSMRNS
jgi:sporulation protein YlmC with PRC-barrel domain